MEGETDEDVNKLIFYKTLVRSILLYCVETWPVTEEQVKKLETMQMYCIRRICGYKLWGTESNAEIRAKHDIPAIQNLVRYHRLRWFGHVVRMPPHMEKSEVQSAPRLPKQVLYGWVDGKRHVGRPKKTWMETLREDVLAISRLKNVRGAFIRWETLCLDRDAWRDLIQELLV